MPQPVTLTTKRLLLRGWRRSDREPFAQMNADPCVMEHFPSRLTRDESDAMVDRIEAGFAERGWGLWAVEVLSDSTFIGFVGLTVPRFEAHFTPCVEVGWRLAHSAWGKGYATEAATASIRFGFETLGLDEIVSMTATTNVRSQRVMERLQMVRDPNDDFDHPLVAEGHLLRRHVLYRLRIERAGS